MNSAAIIKALIKKILPKIVENVQKLCIELINMRKNHLMLTFLDDVENISEKYAFLRTSTNFNWG